MDLILSGAADGKQARFNPHDPQDMEGQKTYIKHQKEQNGEPSSFLLKAAVRLRSLGQGVDNHCVTKCHDHQGKAESSCGQDYIVPFDSGEVIRTGDVQAGGSIGPGGRCDQEGHGNDSHQRNDPHHSTGSHCPPRFVNGKAAYRVTDPKVSEDAETGEEEDAAGQIEIEAEADELAHKIPKDPVFAAGIVVNQEREAGQIQQVCAGQVQHDDGAALPGPHFENVSGNCHCIPWKAHQEDDAVNNREVVPLEWDFFVGAISKSSCIIGEIRSICKIVQWLIHGCLLSSCKKTREFSLAI